MSYNIVMPNGATQTFTGSDMDEVMNKISRELEMKFPNF